MTCPVCGGSVTAVDTAHTCEETYRRRKCKECGHIFFTTESELKTSARDFRYHSVKRRKDWVAKQADNDKN